ncbi:MAG: glycoside hydrolase family 16 protein [Bacteroidales bacterium]|nr:glycoside hydrolase family 16 protein [Bacteroidales bacterium]
MRENLKDSVLLVLVFSLLLYSFTKKEYQLVWQDDFNGMSLDTTQWNHEAAKPGHVNNELQRYTNGENIVVSDGTLKIFAKRENNEYTSGRINTHHKRTFLYGRVDMRAKLPKGVGTWPALWMLGENIDSVGWPKCGELDIMEHVGKHPNFIHSSIHNKSGYGGTPYTGIVEIEDPFNSYHIYSMEWTENFIKFSVDQKLAYTYSPEEKNADTWPFDKPAFLIFNIAVGGDWGGPVVDDKVLPATMTVDWVKVYQKK